MKISGTALLQADRQAVWQALNDPAVLVRTIPGCRRLEAVGEDAYKITVAAGVGAIVGVYDGEVRLTDREQPGSFRMRASGSGAPGTVGADVVVTLAEGVSGGTELGYEAEATVGGMLGGVGQRMLAGVSKRMAAEFFGNVDAALAGTMLAGAGPAGLPGPAPGTSTTAGQVFTAPAVRAGGGPGFAAGVAVGALAALAGAVVGGWLAGRRRGLP